MTTTKSVIARLTLLLAPLFLPLALNHAAAGTRFFCQKTVFPAPRNPCVRYKRICPKPVCPRCPIENFGYFPACWQRWPFPPYYAHCPVPPITLNAPQSPLDKPGRPEELHTPKQVPPEPTSPEKKPAEPTLP
jgi:hypothetical protein